MLFNLNESVRLKEDLLVGIKYGGVKFTTHHYGERLRKHMTIAAIDLLNKTYLINENGLWCSEEMLVSAYGGPNTETDQRVRLIEQLEAENARLKTKVEIQAQMITILQRTIDATCVSTEGLLKFLSNQQKGELNENT